MRMKEVIRTCNNRLITVSGDSSAPVAWTERQTLFPGLRTAGTN